MLGEITGRAKISALKELLQYFEQFKLGVGEACGHGKERVDVGDAGREMQSTHVCSALR